MLSDSISCGQLDRHILKMNVRRSERKIQYIVKSYEKCRPASATSVARSMLAGHGVRDACALCLCAEPSLPLSESVILRDAHTDTDLSLTLRQLIQQLHLSPAPWVYSSMSVQKVCKTCVNRLSSFFLFSKKCIKTATALINIEKLVTTAKRENKLKQAIHKRTNVKLPYQDIFKYVDENMVFNCIQKMKNPSFLKNCTQVINKTMNDNGENICQTALVKVKENIYPSPNRHKHVKILLDEEPGFTCGLCKLSHISWQEYMEHKSVHTCEKLIQIILQNDNFCICCLKTGNDLVRVSQEMIFNENSSLSLSTLFHSIFNLSILDTYYPALMCGDCIDKTIVSFNLKQTFQRSVSTILKCINNFEKSFNKIVENHTEPLNQTKLNVCLNYFTRKIDILDAGTDVKVEGTAGHSLDLKDINNVDISNCDENKYTENLNQENENKIFSPVRQLKKHDKEHKYTKKTSKFCCKKKSKDLICHRKTCQSKSAACKLCNIFIPKTELKLHLIKDHSDNALICDYCHKKYYLKKSLMVHIIRKHITNSKYKCENCDKIFCNTVQIKSHRCRHKCNECLGRKCIHLRFLKAFKKHKDSSPRRKHKCIDCDFLYDYKHEIIGHANKDHLSHYPHLCDICGESFASKSDLKYHRDSRHREILKCPHCNKESRDRLLLDTHIETCKSTYKPFKCDLCIAQFTSEDKMTFHRRKHFPRNFQCEFCQGKYWTKSELNGHLKRSHKDLTSRENSSQKVFQCTMCSLDFHSKKDRMEHVATHSLDSKHICRICSASFKSKINYYGHLKRHKIKKDCECTVCGKMYTKYNISTHMKRHGNIEEKELKSKKKICMKNTMCDICGRLLSNQASLVKHREIHKEQEQCPHCLKFLNSTIFARHLSTHENLGSSKFGTDKKRSRKMFHCNECDYSSIFADCLEAHENRFHLHVRPFKCDICSKGFYAKITLKEHIRTHAGSKPEQCETCGNRFVSKKALRLHMRIHTGEKPYQCELCDERFLSASRRQAHRTRKHFEPSVQCHFCLKMYYTQSAVRIHIRDYHSAAPRQRTNKKTRVSS